MIKVECPGCKAPYQVDERRVPDAGLKMRCPKCATSFVVTKPGAGAASSRGAAKAAAPKARASAPKAPRPQAKAPDDGFGDGDWDLPAPAPKASKPGAFGKRTAEPKIGEIDDMPDLPLPAVTPDAHPGAPPRRGAPPAQNSGGFGEIDLMVDLPAPGLEGEDDIDLPIARAAPPRGAPPPAARGAAKKGGKEAPRARTQLFGDTVPEAAPTQEPTGKIAPIHVPVPGRESRSMKAVGAPPRQQRTTVPETKAPKAAPPVEDSLGFGEIDLPELAPDLDLPAPALDAGLPLPSAGLPLPSVGLPSASGAGLPSVVPGGALPSVADGSGFPAHGRLLSPPPDDFGSLEADDFGAPPGHVYGPGEIAGADIYGGAGYDDSQMDPAFRTEARSVVTNMPAEEPSEPSFDFGAGRPTPVSEEEVVDGFGNWGEEPPAPEPEPDPFGDQIRRAPTVPEQKPPIRRATTAPDADPVRRAPTVPEGRPGPRGSMPSDATEADLFEPTAPPQAPEGMTRGAVMTQSGMAVGASYTPQQAMTMPDLGAGDELEMGSRPQGRFGSDPMDEEAEADLDSGDELDAGTEAPLGEGDEMDLDGARPSGRVSSRGVVIAPSDAAADAAPTGPKRSWRRLIVVAAVAGLFGGALLTLVPDIGPFGLNFISDYVNKGLHNEALETARGIVHDDLDPDTSAGADHAIGKMKTAQRAYPRHRPTAGYAAYVAFQRILRFGPRPEDRAYGDMMIRVSQDQPSDYFLLGQAAQDAVTGQIARARQTMQGLLERRPNDIDVAVLSGEIELLTKSGDQAVKAWQRAVKIMEDLNKDKKSARAYFGLARAQFAAGDFTSAEASARITLETSQKHVGARTLLAQIVWQNGGREQQALELLNKVTEDGEISASAGEPELVAAYTQLGKIHLAKSRMSQAELAFASALKIDPQAVEALIGNGELFYRSGRYSEAVARYEAAIRADADSVLAKIGMAKTQLFLERAKDAKDMLKKLCETRPKEPLAFYWLGRAEEALGNKKEAETAYADAIKVGGDSPQTVEAYVALAQLLSSLGRGEDAAQRLTEASNRFPGLPALHRARGEVALANGDYEDAKKEFEAALAREEDIGTKFKLGSVLRRMRMYDDAGKMFDVVAETDKDYPGLALERGLLFEETGQSERAAEMYAKALQAAPNDLDLKLRVGSTQVIAGHAKQAEPILREVFRAKPNSAEVNHFLGRALLVRGTSLAEAKRYLERAREIDPNRAEYQLYVGWVANELGETQLAEQALNRAIEIDRNLGDAYWQRGVLLQKQGQALDALEDLKVANEKSPSRYEVHATMAYCYQDQSKWPEAEESWKKAIAGNGEVADWHYRLGKVYITRGNRAAATPELDKAVELAEAPDHPTPGWLAEAHFLLGEAYRATNKEKAKRHYGRFLELAPQNHPYRVDAERARDSLNTAP